MTSSPINKLPPEVLSIILYYVGQPASDSLSSHSSVLSCLLCCKAWYSITLPRIYRDIVLRIHNLKRFINQFLRPSSWNNDILQLIQSLTISLKPEDWQTPSCTQAEWNTKIKDQCLLTLEKLPSILTQMTGLTTLSIVIASGSRYDRKDLMGSILAALPESCINLELDIGPTYIESNGPGLEHICEMISPRLSQLHHLRLNIGTICPALFGNHFAIDGSLQRETPPLSSYYYPTLRSLIINCNYRGSALTCNINGANPTSEALPARVALVKCLRYLFLRGSFPQVQRLWLLDGRMQEANDESTCPVWYRRDIANNKTWVMPYICVPGPKPISLSNFYYVIRIPEGRELVTPAKYRSVFAEDQTWKETTLGSRFPAVVLAGREDLIVRVPLALGASEYRSMYNGSCLAWYHEQMTGRKLIWATEREGLVDRSPLHEMTPPGWKRGIDDEGGICGLYPDDGSTGLSTDV